MRPFFMRRGFVSRLRSAVLMIWPLILKRKMNRRETQMNIDVRDCDEESHANPWVSDVVRTILQSSGAVLFL